MATRCCSAPRTCATSIATASSPPTTGRGYVTRSGRRGTTWWSSSCPANTRCTGRSSSIRGNQAPGPVTISIGSRASCGRWACLFSTWRRSSPRTRRAVVSGRSDVRRASARSDGTDSGPSDERGGSLIMMKASHPTLNGSAVGTDASESSPLPSRLLDAEDSFYRGYPWCLNTFPTLHEIVGHLGQELERLHQQEEDWRRLEVM